MFRHIPPEYARAGIVVSASLTVGAAIILEAVLSFLGFGTAADSVAWLADCERPAIPAKVVITVFPGL